MSTPPFSTVWQPDTPATVNENLVVSAPKILGNWNTIAYWGAQDHNPLGQTTNIGQHLQSTYVTQSAVPSADPNNIRLFAQLVEVLSTPPVSTPQVFAQYPTGSPLQLTQTISPSQYFITASGFYQEEVSFTIGGIIIKIGSLIGLPAGSTVISFGASNQVATPTPPASVPFPNSLFFVPVVPITGTPVASAASVNGFTVYALSAGYSAMYIAVGN